MNISYSWLKQYIDINLSPAEVAKVLTSIGLEVEGIESVEKVKGGLEGFVIGEVKTCQKHPDADKLSVTTVDIGQEDLLNIVCGAPNVAAGQKVVVATIGTTVYKGDESFVIRKAKIRGVESEGMICAEDETGMGHNHDGIMVLPETVAVGTPARVYFKAEPETMFVIGLTPNRIDSASHLGVARDLAAYLRKDRDITVIRPSIEAFAVENENYPVEVIIENPKSCRRYAGVSVSGVKVAPSPEWLQNRLVSIGMKPVNNVVDITNFVLHELGQPLHAFDADQLKGRKIIVRNMPEGTPFVTLDGMERKLAATDLMICDGERPVAIGGVFGGLHSGVTETTENIFIESAYFDPVSVRITAKRHNISTDASFRFERGVDPEMTITALKRCALLVKEDEELLIYKCYGTPVDCVKMAFNHLLSDKPDLLVSGINHGSNASTSVFYSGTMGAALEGCINEIPSVGFSLLNLDYDADFTAAKYYADLVIRKVLQNGLPVSVCLNVNIPDGPRDSLAGIRMCRQNKGYWKEEFDKRVDPMGRNYFWLTGNFYNTEPEATDTDEWALEHQYVSIVPQKIDLTCYDTLKSLHTWTLPDN